MPNYLLAYHGDASLPESEEEMATLMSAWQHWFETLGDAVVDPGNPVGQSSTMHRDGSIENNGGSNPVTGYGIIKANDLADAQRKAAGCPVLTEEGGSIEVAEIVEVGE